MHHQNEIEIKTYKSNKKPQKEYSFCSLNYYFLLKTCNGYLGLDILRDPVIKQILNRILRSN